MDGEVIGEVHAVEFVGQNDDEDREPGTYVTIRVSDGSAWSAGTVIIRYTEGTRN